MLHGFQREHQVQEILMELGNRIVSPTFMSSFSFQRTNIFSAVPCCNMISFDDNRIFHVVRLCDN